jgi:hypothetical protein
MKINKIEMIIYKISKPLILLFSDFEKHFGEYIFRYTTENTQ